MENNISNQKSSIRATAVGALLILLGVVIWTEWPQNPVVKISDKTPMASSTIVSTSTPNPLSQASTTVGASVVNQLIASYSNLKQSGAYSPEIAQSIASQMGSTLTQNIKYSQVSDTDIHTDSITSYTRMLAYRADLQQAFKPLLVNTRSELAIFDDFTKTQDPQYLEQLHSASLNYTRAASNTLSVTAPIDALGNHIAIINAMREFASMLDMMVAQAHDPVGSALSLKSFTIAQNDMVTAFNDLAVYISTKKK